jgi:hypothetical protein
MHSRISISTIRPFPIAALFVAILFGASCSGEENSEQASVVEQPSEQAPPTEQNPPVVEAPPEEA